MANPRGWQREVECKQCGEKYRTTSTRAAYCSDTCRNEARRDQWLQSQQKRREAKRAADTRIRCRVCNKPLTSETSISLGVGPDCEGHELA